MRENSMTKHIPGSILEKELTSDELEQSKKTIKIAYILCMINLLIPFTMLVAYIMTHIKSSEVKGSYLESHCSHIAATFWITSILNLVAYVTSSFLTDAILLLPSISLLVFIYLVGQGWLAFKKDKPI